jgi:hypothetical protein
MFKDHGGRATSKEYTLAISASGMLPSRVACLHMLQKTALMFIHFLWHQPHPACFVPFKFSVRQQIMFPLSGVS